MPIRHCQKCGLKVLVDESQLAANPFYCQRCAATAKAAAVKDAGPAAAAPRHTPDPVPAPSPAPAAAAALKSIKVLCPYCRASFTGRVPNKPAKGSCPVCQKDLVLLPDGSIAGASEFSLQQWKDQNQPGKVASDLHKPVIPIKLETRGTKIVRPNKAEPVASGDDLGMPSGLDGLAEHTMLDMGRTAPPRPVPTRAGPRPNESEIEAAFPGGLAEHTILDMGRAVSTPKGTARPSAAEVNDAFPSGMDDQTMLDMGANNAPPPETGDSFPTDMTDQTMLDMGGMDRGAQRTGQAMPLPPPPPPNQEDTKDSDETRESAPVTAEPPPRKETAKRSAPEPAPEPPPRPSFSSQPSQGKGKMVFASFLMLVPAIAGTALFFLKENPGVKNLFEKVGAIAHKGLRRVYEELTKEPPPAPVRTTPTNTSTPKEPEKTPEEKEKDRQALKSSLEGEIQRAHLKILSAKRSIRSMPDPSEGQKEIIKSQEAIIAKQTALYDEKQAEYKKHFGTAYNPADDDTPK